MGMLALPDTCYFKIELLKCSWKLQGGEGGVKSAVLTYSWVFLMGSTVVSCF